MPKTKTYRISEESKKALRRFAKRRPRDAKGRFKKIYTKAEIKERWREFRKMSYRRAKRNA